MALAAVTVGARFVEAAPPTDLPVNYESLRPKPPVITSIQTWIGNAPDWQGGKLYKQRGGDWVVEWRSGSDE